MAVILSAPVGLQGANKPAEVLAVRQQLNAHFARVRTLSQIAVNQLANEELYRAIRVFQFAMGMKAPDSLISPAGRTIAALNTLPATWRMESKPLNGHQEGSPANLQKRSLINTTAISHNRSELWAYNVVKDDFGINTNKCNKFVYDVINEAGASALVSVRGVRRQPLAAEWADPNTVIPGWRVLSSAESPQGGDVAAYPLSGGGGAFSGHTGLIISTSAGLTNISAHGDAVYSTPGQFENNATTRYRRYTGV